MSDATPPRPRLAVYVPHFLTASMTFVYRQLTGVSAAFETCALATSTEHLERYPFSPLHVRRSSLADAALRTARRLAGRWVSDAGPLQQRGFASDLARFAPDLVHAHFGPGGLDMLPVARRLRRPLLVTFHGFDASRLLRDPRYVRELQALFRYAEVIGVSARMASQLRELGARDGATHHHYIGVPLEAFAYVERRPAALKMRAGEPVGFLQVSSFVEKKGHPVTVEAFARFHREYPQSALTFAGTGPLRAAVEADVRGRGLDGVIRFAGKVDQAQVARHMAEADVFLHHSVTAADGDQEGIPTVLMEAMAMGLVVVSTRHAGIPELVEHGREGFLVGERDVEGYVGALRALAQADPELPRRARAKVERDFDMARQNRRLEGIYRGAIARGAPGAGAGLVKTALNSRRSG